MNFNLLLSEDFNKYAANVTVSGLVIVFAMLILLVMIIIAFGKIMSSNQNKESKPKAEPKAEKPVAAQVVTPSVVSADDEIIAVISAAVAAVYSGSGKTAIVRSIKPAGTAGRSAWGTAGLHQNVKSF